jgi:NAD(P)-dependent dehydrogenase (short-subunit alcohol dehydrogenase family)
MQAFSLKNKVALITGGSRGLGREMAIAYARAGARTVITAAAAPDETQGAVKSELAAVVDEMKAAGGDGLAVYADVTQWEDCIGAVRQAVETFGALHVLVNNAALSQRYHGARGIPFWETDPQGWLRVIATNVVGPYYMAKASAPSLLRAGWGRIVNISKHPDQMHEAYAGAYGPSKAALEAESLSWAEELLSYNVTVNSLDPGGAVNTTFGRGVIRNVGLDPSVIVSIALWLASEASDGITGCRFDAKRWDDNLPMAEAAELCREGPIFPLPISRTSPLDLAWRAPTAPASARLPRLR